MIVDYYYGSLVLAELCCPQNITLTYGKVFVVNSKATFQKWASHLQEKITDRNKDELIVWIGTVPLGAMHHINKCKYFLGDDSLELEAAINVCENDVALH